MSTNTGISITHIFFFVGRSIGNILDGVGGSEMERPAEAFLLHPVKHFAIFHQEERLSTERDDDM